MPLRDFFQVVEEFLRDGSHGTRIYIGMWIVYGIQRLLLDTGIGTDTLDEYHQPLTKMVWNRVDIVCAQYSEWISFNLHDNED